MKRFLCGAVAGGATGTLTWWLSDNVVLSVVLGSLVALVIWFTAAGDAIAELAESAGSALGKGLDDLW